MASSWPAVRAQLATLLTGIAITTPIATSIKKVYQVPPDALMVRDMPSLVILRSHKHTDRYVGLREKDYGITLRLMVYDADLGRSLDIVDNFEEVIIDAFDVNHTIGGLVTGGIQGPLWGKWGTVDEGGQKVAVVDGEMQFRLADGVVFA